MIAGADRVTVPGDALARSEFPLRRSEKKRPGHSKFGVRRTTNASAVGHVRDSRFVFRANVHDCGPLTTENASIAIFDRTPTQVQLRDSPLLAHQLAQGSAGLKGHSAKSRAR